MSYFVSDLRALIVQLREADREFRVFGSPTHRYQLRPCLSRVEVEAFEDAHRVALPDDYRTFLLEAGDGGAGPYFGVASLAVAARDSTLAEPFPFVEATDSLDEEDVTLEYVQDHDPGVLRVCHYGSGLFFFLVVTGPARGSIWMGREHFYPEATSFAEWYGTWTTQKLALLRNESLVAKLRLGMTADEVDRATGMPWKKRETSTMRFYESSAVPAQLELDDNDVVIAVNSSRFL